ncbi:MAG: hypothetical protein JXQ96_20145 [Cyclobacteriaceae bacterium]
MKIRKNIMDRQSILILSIVGIAVIGMVVYQLRGSLPKSTAIEQKQNIPADLVCMVNDAYMGKKQIEVPVGDQIYYGCCEMCVTRLQNQRETRYAIDPYSGKEVDKANAFIVLKQNGNDAVWYFSSAENHQKFVKQKGR